MISSSVISNAADELASAAVSASNTVMNSAADVAADVASAAAPAFGNVMNSAVEAVGAVGTKDPTEFLNTQLASALSTLGDAQYWEETISATTIRTELSACDPSNPNSTPILQKGMKWLLASISKGRDVSDFYPHVVKLVGAYSLEVRKMVYMYLVQYADHDVITRELSLLSINAFQRGLSDSEQLIRALALRVLSSIRINDILQIQILGVQKCAIDVSPYVRKCAANALSKLVPRCDEMQREILLQLMQEQFLDKDSNTMVLTSALVAFCELCPERLQVLHTSYRKICHLLTDMDEWGQVVVIDLMARYCRRFFKEPKALKQGMAELIDQERRVQRRLLRGGQRTTTTPKERQKDEIAENDNNHGGNAVTGGAGFKDFVDSNSSNTSSYKDKNKTTRRVTTKGFYSDEEDGSTEEEIYTASAMRQPTIIGNATANVLSGINNGLVDSELKSLDPDHQLLLTSSMPLLKSRNAGVVLAVCSLHYYCGVSSVKARSAIGKALVRIHRGRREIQYVVLTSIRVLVRDCPSAFSPFLSDFFVKALDPPFTRLIKIDILVSLALEPVAIEAILNELRTYIRHGDKVFSTTAIRAVGRVTELARIVYDRHGESNGMAVKERRIATRIALNALYGLSSLTQASYSKVVVGEAVSVMQSILLSLSSSTTLSDGSTIVVEDPNQVQAFALRRILLLLVSSLSNRKMAYIDSTNEDSDDEEKEASYLEKVSIDLPSSALSSALWTVGEWMTNTSIFGASSWTQGSHDMSGARVELVRLVDCSFPNFKAGEKVQAIHFASKIWLSHVLSNNTSTSTSEIALCEHILAMGRVDVNPDVKDRTLFESSLLHACCGLKCDTTGIIERPGATVLDIKKAKDILLANKPSPSYLPIDDDASIDMNSFRFGTLSSLVGHRVRGAYLSLPEWAQKNSPRVLREPIEAAKEQLEHNFSDPAQMQTSNGTRGFYDENDSNSSDSSSEDSADSDTSSSNSESSDSSSDNSESDDDSSSSSDDSDNRSSLAPSALTNNTVQNGLIFQPIIQQKAVSTVPAFQSNHSSAAFSSSDNDSSDSDDDSSDDSDIMPSTDILNSTVSEVIPNHRKENLIGMISSSSGFAPEVRNSSKPFAYDDLKGLVMEPIKVEAQKFDVERDSSAWLQYVRPELCGGLSVKARYLRGTTKENELKMKNIDPSKSNVVCVQLQFTNEKSDSSSIRRIRVLPRSSGTGAYASKKILCPSEIMELKANQTTRACLVIEFASMSNREGDLVGRIEVKQGYGGTVPIDIKPPLGELLWLPEKNISVDEFDRTMTRMQGFQRVESSYTTSLPMTSVVDSLLKHSSLKTIGSANFSSDKKLRLMGMLPANNEPVLVKLEATQGGGKIAVCCDNVVAINIILNLVKRAIN